MEILQNTAEGQVEAPELSFKVLNENYELPFKLCVLWLLPVFFLYQVDSFIAYIVVANIIVFYLILLPASVMTLAYTHSLFAAINPFGLISLVKRIGWSYGILYVFLMFLNGGASAAYYFLVGDSVSNSSIFFEWLFQIYFLWVMCGMMGYVLYQYHEEIGYEVFADDGAELDTHSLALVGFDELVEDENYAAAQDVLKDIILRDPENLDLRKKFHRVVKMSGNNKQLTVHGMGLIGRLLDRKQSVDAVNVYYDCLKVDADFKLENDSHYLPLVQEMRRMRNHQQAIKLSNGFHQLYPESTHTPNLYLLIAKIFIEDLSQDDKAKPILSFLKKNYVGHEVELEVDRYSAFLTKV